MSRASALAIVVGLLAAALGVDASTTGRQQPPRTLDAVLADYRTGRAEAVAEAFTTSRDFRRFRVAEPRVMERWLGPWDAGKAVMLLEMMHEATRTAPQFAGPILTSGRRYIRAARRSGQVPLDRTFVMLWHRTALGMLQGSGSFALTEDYARSLLAPLESDGPPGEADPRVRLAFAIARAQVCWVTRPELDRPSPLAHSIVKAAGADLDDPTRPSRGVLARQDERQDACLSEAVERFAEAAKAEETKVEARLRGGWVLYQQGKLVEALEQLAVEPGEDPDLRYWALLFRGRVLDALGRYADAAEMFQTALDECPDAQSAGVGLALALFRLDRRDEADELARSLRARPGGDDPWLRYERADHRFVERWLGELRVGAR